LRDTELLEEIVGVKGREKIVVNIVKRENDGRIRGEIGVKKGWGQVICKENG